MAPMTAKRILHHIGVAVSSILLSVLTFGVCYLVLGGANPLDLFSPTQTVRAPFAVAPTLSPEKQTEFIDSERTSSNYMELSANGKATWETVAGVLYGKLGAYDLHFELTDDPAKNCAQIVHHNKGGCYQQGGQYDRMIFISPDIDEPNAEFIAYHEYSHYLQDREGYALNPSALKKHARFSADMECDADLRALQLRGSWVPGFEYQCRKAGFTMEQLTLENLPNLEAQLKETTHSRDR